jgi:xanthine/uracil permease
MDRRTCHVLKIFAALALGVLVCACTKMQPVLPDDLSRLASLVVPGDTVRCNFRDGSSAAFNVSAVEPNTLIEKSGNRVAIANITSAKIEHFDRTKSILLGLGILAMIAAAFVLSASALGSRSDIAFVADEETPQPTTNESS